MLRLALRNLFQSRVRLGASAGGVALALLLILSLDAVVAGMERQLTAYIDGSGADIIVAQGGVRNMHMASSTMNRSVRSRVRALRGVVGVSPIQYATNMITAGEHRHLAYIIGLPRDATMGLPPRVVAGVAFPGRGEAVIDRSVAEAADLQLGDEVKILGMELTVVGLSQGTTSLVNSIAFISQADFLRARGDGSTMSFLLVRVAPGVEPTAVAARIEALAGDVTAQSRAAFSAEERKVVKDMSADVLTIMNLVGLLIGLAVMALTIYTATLARRKEYGVLKALGARSGQLYQAVLWQAAVSVLLGLGLAVGATQLLTITLPRLEPNLVLALTGASLLKVSVAALLIAGAAALVPIRQLTALDPAQVFRGGVR
jgi:putative ABC transport system permease protein